MPHRDRASNEGERPDQAVMQPTVEDVDAPTTHQLYFFLIATTFALKYFAR